MGHTHEDIDGLFGILSRKLENANAFTPDDMNALIEMASRSASTVQERGKRFGVGFDNGFLPGDTEESRHWKVVADWRSWLRVCCLQLHHYWVISVLCYFLVQPRMHEFFGLGTTHITEVGEDTGIKEVLKVRVHSLLMKLAAGKACVFWKEFMRDKTWLLEDNIGWPVFKEGVDLSLSTLEPMPTRPISNFDEVEKRLKVSLLFVDSLFTRHRMFILFHANKPSIVFRSAYGSGKAG